MRATNNSALNDFESKLGTTVMDFNVKPKLLEGKLAASPDFAALSDGFKKIFAQDKSDVKMVVPIAGFGGHRRGDKSQNFFGKSFRENSLQSLKLQRDLRVPMTHIVPKINNN